MVLKGVALNPIGQKQFIDHLAPIATILQIPYLFHEEEEEALVKSLYPDLNTLYLPYEEFNPEYLISHFDCIFLSDQWQKKTFDEKFKPLETAYGKKMRNIHCPHGFSDKGFYLRGVAFEDISLIYGQNMLDLLQEWGVLKELKQYVFCGNYRYLYYQKHKSFYDKTIKPFFQNNHKTILYAPTCVDLEDSSSFFSVAPLLLQSLPSNLNLIIKPHPRLEQDEPARFYQMMSLAENKENVLFLKDFPLIYPLLSQTDIYLGDMSSIGYDFLAFNRPMFFLNEQKRDQTHDRGLYLFRCGTTIEPEQYELIYEIIPNQTKNYSDIQKEVYSYTFAEDISFEKLQIDLMDAISRKNP